MTEFTPGPWEVCMSPPNEYWFAGVTIGAADPGDARRICDVNTMGARGDDIHPMHQANARLIAAAPDLLRALRGILSMVPFHHSHRGVEREGLDAIAKALGTSND